MLVLTRHEGESIIITGTEQIEVRVASVRHKKIRLAIMAPKNVRVDRKEIHYKRIAEGKES